MFQGYAALLKLTVYFVGCTRNWKYSTQAGSQSRLTARSHSKKHKVTDIFPSRVLQIKEQ